MEFHLGRCVGRSLNRISPDIRQEACRVENYPFREKADVKCSWGIDFIDKPPAMCLICVVSTDG